MAGTLLDLQRRMQRLAKRIPEAVNELKRETVEVMGRDLITVTPVDTSEALSNWQGSSNAPVGLPIPAIVPGHHGDTQSASVGEAIEHLHRVAAEVKPGEAFYLSNVVEHIVPLNNGSSSQAPAGFVERAELLGRLHIKETKLKLE